MIETSNEIAKLVGALHGAQGEIEGVKRDGINPHFKNRYASLEAVIDTARPALQAHGLAFTQAPGCVTQDGMLEVTTMLMHVSGEWMRSTLHVPLVKRDAQAVGSATTYGCRYALMAVLGLPPVDDDGEAASKPVPHHQAPVTVNGRPAGSNGTRRYVRPPEPEPLNEEEQDELQTELEQAIDGCLTQDDVAAIATSRRRDFEKLSIKRQGQLRQVASLKRQVLATFGDEDERAQP